MGIDVERNLKEIKEQVDIISQKFPDFKIYVTVSKAFNDELTKFLGTEDYGIRLEELYGCKYQVSPFVDRYNWIVGLFDYSQILGQWNTFQDHMYKLSHLFTYATSNGEESNQTDD